MNTKSTHAYEPFDPNCPALCKYCGGSEAQHAPSVPAPAEDVTTILDSSVESHLREEVRIWVENEKSDIKHLARKGSIWENVVHYIGLAGMAPKLPVRLERGFLGGRKAYRVAHKDGTATPWRLCEEAATLYADLAAMVEAVIDPRPAEPVKVLGGEVATPTALLIHGKRNDVDVSSDTGIAVEYSDDSIHIRTTVGELCERWHSHAAHLATIAALEALLLDCVRDMTASHIVDNILLKEKNPTRPELPEPASLVAARAALSLVSPVEGK